MEGGNHSMFVYIKQQSWWHLYCSLSNYRVCSLWRWARIRGLHVDGLSLGACVHCNQQRVSEALNLGRFLNLRDLQGCFLWILMLFSLYPFVLPAIEEGGLQCSASFHVFATSCFISSVPPLVVLWDLARQEVSGGRPVRRSDDCTELQVCLFSLWCFAVWRVNSVSKPALRHSKVCGPCSCCWLWKRWGWEL